MLADAATRWQCIEAGQEKAPRDRGNKMSFKILAKVKGPLGNEFNVVLTPAGERSPRGAGKYVPKKAEVEFFDARYQNDERFAPLGQFVASYLVSTLTKGGTIARVAGGLDLVTYEPSWKISAEGMETVRAALAEVAS